jgi:hypothetical protein
VDGALGMSVSFALIAAAMPIYSYQCELLFQNPDALIVAGEPRANVTQSTLIFETDMKNEEAYVSLDTPKNLSFSARRQKIRVTMNEHGGRTLWPSILKTDAKGQIQLDFLTSTSTHTGGSSALLIREGGDFVVAGLVESDESYAAVGLCSEIEQRKYQ